MMVSLFQLGVLQFQPFEMVYLDEQTLGDPYITFSPAQKERLPSGAPVINCHIPRGADLSPEAVQAPFQNAKALFVRHFPARRYQAFLCYSWQLYPPMLRFLFDTSNIKRFAGLFSIIGSCPDAERDVPPKTGRQIDRTLRLCVRSNGAVVGEQMNQTSQTFFCPIIESLMRNAGSPLVLSEAFFAYRLGDKAFRNRIFWK